MTKLKLLLLCTLLWAVSSGCINGAFRHYDSIPAYLPSVKTQHFVGPLKEVIGFTEPEAEDLVCFKIQDFTKHEKECHAK